MEDKIMNILFSIITIAALIFGIFSSANANTNGDLDSLAKSNQSVVQGKLVLQKKVLEALVEPYIEEIINQNGNDERILVWVIADDGKSYKVFYNQETKKFGLAKYAKGSTPFTSDSLHVQNELTKAFLAH